MTRTLPEGLFEKTQIGEASTQTAKGVSLRIKESGKFININYEGWATIAPTKETEYLLVPYDTQYYIVVANSRWSGYYLSYNNQFYVGAYKNWLDARWWTVDPVDCSRYPGLYPYNNYLCCNGKADAPDKVIIVEAS